MAMLVKLQWEDGKPCESTRVCAWINGEGNAECWGLSEGTVKWK